MKLWRKTQIIIGVAIFLFGFILGSVIIIKSNGLDAPRPIASPITYIGLFITGISVMLKLKTSDSPLHDERTKKVNEMKSPENKKILLWNKINLALSIVLLVLASFWVLQNIYRGKPFYAGNSLIWILLGLTLLASSYMNNKRIKMELEGKVTADERSRRAAQRAGVFAFFVLIACLIVSGLINSIFNLNLEYTITVNVIMVACVSFWIILANYIDRKGAAL